MEAWTILHITDLHIGNPDAKDDLFREDHFREYLTRLVNSIPTQFRDKIQCLIATGDFIHKGEINNFQHATKIIEFLAIKLELESHKISVCPGNHDIDRNVDKTGDANKAREAYIKFANSFSNGNGIRSESGRAVFCNPADAIWCLMIDTTLGSMGTEYPGELTIEEEDDLFNKYIRDIDKDDLLIIGTHHLADVFPGLVAPAEGQHKNWHEKHLWSRGSFLRERISLWRGQKEAQTLWLCGDSHFPLHHSPKALQYFCVTGRLGTLTSNTDPPQRRQAEMITISRDRSKLPIIFTFEYSPGTYVAQSRFGEWNYRQESMQYISEANPNIIVKTESLENNKRNTEYEPQVANIEEVNDSVIEAIDSELQNRLVEVIEKQRLYNLGRFNTSPHGVALSWVPIGPLLNERGLLPSIIIKMNEWLDNKLKQYQQNIQENAVLLGIDCWGAVLASQLSVISGATNYCIASRARGKYHTIFELISDSVIDKIRNAKAVILVSDVVSTGESLRFIYEQVNEKLTPGDHPTPLIWIALSIIHDISQSRKVNCNFLKYHGTICSSLKMPILSNDQLPNENILPPTLYFK